MAEKPPIFEKTYHDYLAQVAKLDFKKLAEKLGIQVAGDEAIIPFFGSPHIVSAKGITDPSGNRPTFSVCVVLCKYLLLCPDDHPQADDWASFKDYRDAAPFAEAFFNYTERPIAKHFSGRLSALEKACKKIGSRPPASKFLYDFSRQFDALPKVPILMLFNDADDEFPAQCIVLFERRAEKYLDMECLAILGMLLFEYLKAGSEDLAAPAH